MFVPPSGSLPCFCSVAIGLVCNAWNGVRHLAALVSLLAVGLISQTSNAQTRPPFVPPPSPCFERSNVAGGWQETFGLPWDGRSSLVLGAEVSPRLFEVFQTTFNGTTVDLTLIGYYLMITRTECGDGFQPAGSGLVPGEPGAPPSLVSVEVLPLALDGELALSNGPRRSLRLMGGRTRISIDNQVACSGIDIVGPVASEPVASGSGSLPLLQQPDGVPSGSVKELTGGPRGPGRPTTGEPNQPIAGRNKTAAECAEDWDTCTDNADDQRRVDKAKCTYFDVPTILTAGGLGAGGGVALGSICPVVGNIAGGIIGAVVGGIGGSVLNKLSCDATADRVHNTSRAICDDKLFNCLTKAPDSNIR